MPFVEAVRTKKTSAGCTRATAASRMFSRTFLYAKLRTPPTIQMAVLRAAEEEPRSSLSSPPPEPSAMASLHASRCWARASLRALRCWMRASLGMRFVPQEETRC